MKMILIVAPALLVFGFTMGNQVHNASAATECPVNSYEIAEGVCKANPTGCQYGDSIPMSECSSHKPVLKKKAPQKTVQKKVINRRVQCQQ